MKQLKFLLVLVATFLGLTAAAQAAPPAYPTGISGTVYNGAVGTSWNDNATNEVDYLFEWVKTSQKPAGLWPNQIVLPANSTSKVITGLTNGIKYDFRVTARNADGVSYGQFPSFVRVTPLASAPLPPGGSQCSDGIDNADPEDTLVDLADPGCVNAADNDETDPAGGLPARWDPAANTMWQWTIGQRETRLNLPVAAYDVDWQQTTVADVSALHANGKKVICYFNAGAYQPGQPDEAQWTEAMKGSGVEGWPGEFWADIRRADVRAIMANRIQTCKDKGFDAIEPDNQDGFDNPSGFPLTAADQLDYNRFLAVTAHQKGLAAFLKNDVGQTAAGAGGLRDWYDGAINEQCWTYDECNVYDGWVASGRPVLQVEYSDDAPGKPANWCDLANTAGFRSALATLDLSGTPWTPCWPAGTAIDTGGTTTAGP